MRLEFKAACFRSFRDRSPTVKLLANGTVFSPAPPRASLASILAVVTPANSALPDGVFALAMLS